MNFTVNGEGLQILCIEEEKQKLEKISKDQLRRASLGILFYIAEETIRLSNEDKRNFYIIARGGTIECIALLDYLHQNN